MKNNYDLDFNDMKLSSIFNGLHTV